MGAYDDVDFARGQVGKHLFHLFGLAGTAQVVDTHREVFQTFAEGVVMLKCKYGGRDEHCSLLAVDSRLESGANCHLSLAETNVTAH